MRALYREIICSTFDLRWSWFCGKRKIKKTSIYNQRLIWDISIQTQEGARGPLSSGGCKSRRNTNVARDMIVEEEEKEEEEHDEGKTNSKMLWVYHLYASRTSHLFFQLSDLQSCPIGTTIYIQASKLQWLLTPNYILHCFWRL